MKKYRIGMISLLLVIFCLVLAGCDKGKVTAYINISTQTGAGEFAMDLYIRSDDDTNTQLANGIDGIKQSIQAYGEEKGIALELAARQETVQKWDDNEDDELPEDHEADVINVKFTFDSLEDLNAKMLTLSDGGEIAAKNGFAGFISNPDGTTTFSYWNKAIEEVVLAIATHIHDDPNAYSGTEASDGLAQTDFFEVTVDDNTQEMNLQAYSAFPNRHFEISGTYVDESKIVTPTPAITEAPTPTAPTAASTGDASADGNDAAAANTTDNSAQGSSFPTGALVIGIVAVVCAVAVFVILQKKKQNNGESK